MKSVTVYTTENCTYCSSAKMLLGRREVSYEEINLARDPDGRARLAEQTGMITFPQIVIDGESIGGFRELLALDKSGRLQAMLAENAAETEPAPADASSPAADREDPHRGARGGDWQRSHT